MAPHVPKHTARQFPQPQDTSAGQPATGSISPVRGLPPYDANSWQDNLTLEDQSHHVVPPSSGALMLQNSTVVLAAPAVGVHATALPAHTTK
jgi:hypothetical protein